MILLFVLETDYSSQTWALQTTVALQHHTEYICMLSRAVGHRLTILLGLMRVPLTILCLMLLEEAKMLDIPGLEALGGTDSRP